MSEAVSAAVSAHHLAPGGPADAPEARVDLAGTVAEDLVVVVAPSTGRFRPLLSGGDRKRAGDLLGHVTGGSGRADEVRCPTDATVRDLLVRPGQLVSRGQGLAWLARVLGAGGDGALVGVTA